jgi:hypothetical protein
MSSIILAISTAGRDAANSLREKLQRFAGERRILVFFIHIAIEEGDIYNFDAATGQALVGVGRVARWLPTREPKRKTAAASTPPSTSSIASKPRPAAAATAASPTS